MNGATDTNKINLSSSIWLTSYKKKPCQNIQQHNHQLCCPGFPRHQPRWSPTLCSKTVAQIKLKKKKMVQYYNFKG